MPHMTKINNIKSDFRVIIRDWEWYVVGTLRRNNDLYSDPLLAGAFAALRAIKFFKDVSLKPIIVSWFSTSCWKDSNTTSWWRLPWHIYSKNHWEFSSFWSILNEPYWEDCKKIARTLSKDASWVLSVKIDLDDIL